MATTDVTPQPKLHEGTPSSRQPVVNDFSIQVATVNGSGADGQHRADALHLPDGYPVSGKNMFPSNIAGLPTWFTIRASKHGYIGAQEGDRLPGGHEPRDRARRRDEAGQRRRRGLRRAAEAQRAAQRPALLSRCRSTSWSAPVCPEAKLRKLVRNMIYDGVVAQLLAIDMEEVRKALVKQFGKKKAKAAELNLGAVPGRLRLRRRRPSPRPIRSAWSA